MPKLNNIIKIKKSDYDLIKNAYPNSAQISTGVTLTYDPNSLYLVESTTDFSLLDVYPIGSIYMSVESTNPGTLFGGTWEQIKDKFLLASGDTYQPGTTGGDASYTFTINLTNLPQHRHDFSITTASKSVEVGGQTYSGTISSSGSHSHSVSVSGTATGGSHNHNMTHKHTIGIRYGVDGAQGGTNTRYLWQGEPDTGQKGDFYQDVTYSGYTATDGSHSHSYSVSASTSNTGSHSHTIPSGTTSSKSVEVGGQTANGYTAYGGGQSSPSSITVPTLPPYLAVYMWKRTA